MISAARFVSLDSFGEPMLAIAGPKGAWTHVELSGEAIGQARMFAAAPDGLALAEMVAEWCETLMQGGGLECTYEVQQAALAFIAKAKGDAS